MMEVFFNSPYRDLNNTQDWAPSDSDDLGKANVQSGNTAQMMRAGDGSQITCLQVLHATSNTVVRLVHHEAYDKPLLGKFYNGHVSNKEAIQRFRNEAAILTMFRGKDVPYFRESGEHGERPYILMDTIPGVSLQAISDAAEGRPLPLRAVQCIGAGLASTLASIHEAGVVHRDIKPGNAILRDDGGVSIIDFGLAGRRRGEELRLTQEGQTMGTPRYLGPESFLASSRNTPPASDIYGLGLTLAELAMGRHPMSDDQVYALKRGNLTPVDYGAQCLQAVHEITLRDTPFGLLLERMIDIDIDKRPTAAQVVEALTGMPLERYRAQSPKHRSLSWTVPTSTGTRPMLSIFGETKEVAAHAMVEAIQRMSKGSTRRNLLIGAGMVTAAVTLTALAKAFDVFSGASSDHSLEQDHHPFNPFDRIGRERHQGVAFTTREGESCVWVFRLLRQELETLGIRIGGGPNEVPCTLFYRGRTSFLYIPGSGIHRLGSTSEGDVRQFLDSLPALDGPITIPPGFPGNEASWRSTVNGRIRMLREEIRAGARK